MVNHRGDNKLSEYFQFDKNKIYLEIGKKYSILYKNKKASIEVIREYKYFYMVKLDNTYTITIHKFHDDIDFV